MKSPLKISQIHRPGYEWKDCRMFMDLNDSAYELVAPDPDIELDILFVPESQFWNDIGYKYKIKLTLDIWHTAENWIKFSIPPCQGHNHFTITGNVGDRVTKREKVILYDFVFNRTKAYYTQYPFSLGYEKWYHHNQHFSIPQWEPVENRKKIYVAPIRCSLNVGQPRLARIALAEHLKNNNFLNLGHVGTDYYYCNPLYPQSQFPYNLTAEQLENENSPVTVLPYCPPHDRYYQNTFISIYGETIEHGTTYCITEKTYDPLIRGHFILPYSNYGFIEQLRSQGFLLPNFIDYTYDTYEDNNQRLKAYLIEVSRLLNIPLMKWREYCHNNQDLIIHNQRQFYRRDFQKIDLESLIEQCEINKSSLKH